MSEAKETFELGSGGQLIKAAGVLYYEDKAHIKEISVRTWSTPEGSRDATGTEPGMPSAKNGV